MVTNWVGLKIGYLKIIQNPMIYLNMFRKYMHGNLRIVSTTFRHIHIAGAPGRSGVVPWIPPTCGVITKLKKNLTTLTEPPGISYIIYIYITLYNWQYSYVTGRYCRSWALSVRFDWNTQVGLVVCRVFILDLGLVTKTTRSLANQVVVTTTENDKWSIYTRGS